MKAIGVSLFVVGLIFVSGGTFAADMTSKIQKLGNPYEDRYKSGPAIYARNIWTMKEYKGKIYLGAGNSSNAGPAPNAGPVPIIAFNPATGDFETEWTVPDEQIDVYRVMSDGLLYIPGHDPKEDWSLGNFYRKTAEGSWEKVRTMPDGVHNYDMADFNGKLFSSGYGVGISGDRGKTMKTVYAPGGRAYSLLRFDNFLFSAAEVWFAKKNEGRGTATLGLYNEQKGYFEKFQTETRNLFPDTEPPVEFHPMSKLLRTTPYKNFVLFLGGLIHNDHQSKPFAAYAATTDGKVLNVKRIQLAPDAIPWDIKVPDDKNVYVLSATPIAENRFKNAVWQSSAPDGDFKEILSFNATTFARSFEYYDGAFYFGMGTDLKSIGSQQGSKFVQEWDVKELREECGEIYRIPHPSIRSRRKVPSKPASKKTSSRKNDSEKNASSKKAPAKSSKPSLLRGK